MDQEDRSGQRHDEPDPEEARVRRLLADARHTAPMPADVAARLESVLADLRHGGATASPAVAPGGPDERQERGGDLAAARRRRNARTWLVAAAAVVAVGVGVDALAGRIGSGETSDSASGGTASTLQAPESGAADSPAPHRESGSDGSAAQPPPGSGVTLPRLDADGFADEVARLQRRVLSGDAAGPSYQPSSPPPGETTPSSGGCSAPGPGRRIAVLYDGRPGVVVYRPVRGDTRVVDLYLCDRSGVARSVTLPVR